MSEIVINDLQRVLLGIHGLARRGLDRVKDDVLISERITPIAQQMLDTYASVTKGDSAGTFDPANRPDWFLSRTKGHEITHNELLLTLATRGDLARQLLDATKELIAHEDVQSPSRIAFAVRGAIQDIYFGELVGEHEKYLHGGYLGALREELGKDRPDATKLTRLGYWIGTDLKREPELEYAQAKMRLTQYALAEIGDFAKQQRAVQLIADGMRATQLHHGTQSSHIDAAQFEEVMGQRAQVAVRRLETHPDLVPPNATNPNRLRVLPVRPRSDADDFATQLATNFTAARNDLAQGGRLWYGELDRTRKNDITIKWDGNMGVDLTPTVTQGEMVYAFLNDSFKRADQWNQTVEHRVLESNGAENFYVGRRSSATARDCGIFHYAMKAGLERVKARNVPASNEWIEANRLLGELKEAQDRGYFYGSATHRIDKGRVPANERMDAWLERFEREFIQPMEDACKGYVAMTDPDLDPPEKGGGFQEKPFAEGVLETATYGGGIIKVASAWENADKCVYLARATTTHTLPGVTGPGKGLIGLVLTGTRPADTVTNRSGNSIVDLFPAIANSTGLTTILARGGFKGLMESLFGGPERPELKAERDAFKTAWGKLERSHDALEHFRAESGRVQDYLAGPDGKKMSEAERFAYVREGIRNALIQADDISPGFFDEYWEATRTGTRLAERAAAVIGGLIPDDTRGAGIGPQIGLMQMTVRQPDEVWTFQEVKVDQDPRKKGRSGPDAFPEDSIVRVPGGAALIGGLDARVVGMKAAAILGYPAEGNHSLNASLAFDRRNDGFSSLPIHANLIKELPQR